MTRISSITRTATVLSRGVSHKIADPYGHQFARVPSDSSTGKAAKFVFANVFSRNSTFLTAVVASAIVFGSAYDYVMDAAWEYNNQGKLFKDVIKRYPGLPPNTEAEEEA